MEEEYISDNESVESVIDYEKLNYKLEENIERIYEDVIVPYLNNFGQKEILENLGEFELCKFFDFFENNSRYFKYIQKNRE